MGLAEKFSEKRPYLEARSRILQAVRTFFHTEGFLEVQTPLITRAPAPEAHIDAVSLRDGGYLITSPELFMKRLLAAGYGRIFQVTPAFRKGEHGRYHHPEFTLLEWYRAHADYTDLLEDCRSLLQFLSDSSGGIPGADHRGEHPFAEVPWEVHTVREAFARFAGWSPGPDVDQELFDRTLVETVEPRLGFPNPCILKDYPANQAALARLKRDDSSVAERFEVYWKGVELANGFSELTDPREQRERFEVANHLRSGLGFSPYPMPEAFLESLEDLPPCAGIALGFDRLVMLLTNASRLDEVVAFPPGSE